MPVKPVPEGYHTATPYLVIKGAAKAIDFYKSAFGATELMRMEDGGRIGHAEIKIGDSVIMLADEYPEMDYREADLRTNRDRLVTSALICFTRIASEYTLKMPTVHMTFA